MDLDHPAGGRFAGMLAVFAESSATILRDRVKAGIAQAQGRSTSTPGRRQSPKAQEIRRLAHEGVIAESVP